MNKKALIIVDPQLDFIDGSLAVPNASAIIPIINSIDKSKFDCVILTKDNHPKVHVSFASTHFDDKDECAEKLFTDHKLPNGSVQKLWPDHCMQDDHGSEFHPELDLNIDKLFIFKKGENPNVDSYSGFLENDKKTSTGLAEFLNKRGIEATFICGLATDVCVKFTALDSVEAGFNTFVILDACRGIAEDLTANNFELMNKGVTLLDTTELK